MEQLHTVKYSSHNTVKALYQTILSNREWTLNEMAENILTFYVRIPRSPIDIWI